VLFGVEDGVIVEPTTKKTIERHSRELGGLPEMEKRGSVPERLFGEIFSRCGERRAEFSSRGVLMAGVVER
jgi:hypothetical protein